MTFLIWSRMILAAQMRSVALLERTTQRTCGCRFDWCWYALYPWSWNLLQGVLCVTFAGVLIFLRGTQATLLWGSGEVWAAWTSFINKAEILSCSNHCVAFLTTTHMNWSVEAKLTKTAGTRLSAGISAYCDPHPAQII